MNAVKIALYLTTSIEQEFMKWINANGKPLEGLRKRRHSEWVLYSTGKLDV